MSLRGCSAQTYVWPSDFIRVKNKEVSRQQYISWRLDAYLKRSSFSCNYVTLRRCQLQELYSVRDKRRLCSTGRWILTGEHQITILKKTAPFPLCPPYSPHRLN
jgi:hypothetical protein